MQLYLPLYVLKREKNERTPANALDELVETNVVDVSVSGEAEIGALKDATGGRKAHNTVAYII